MILVSAGKGGDGSKGLESLEGLEGTLAEISFFLCLLSQSTRRTMKKQHENC